MQTLAECGKGSQLFSLHIKEDRLPNPSQFHTMFDLQGGCLVYQRTDCVFSNPQIVLVWVFPPAPEGDTFCFRFKRLLLKVGETQTLKARHWLPDKRKRECKYRLSSKCTRTTWLLQYKTLPWLPFPHLLLLRQLSPTLLRITDTASSRLQMA